MNSMTGYGRASAVLESQTVTVQVNSVNRRTLDLSMKLPDEWESLEAAVAEAVRKAVVRGKVHVAVEVTGAKGVSAGWDTDAIAETLDKLADLSDARGLKFKPKTELLWQIANAQRNDALRPSADLAAPVLRETLAAALRGLSAMRAKEGEALLIDFLGRLQKLNHGVEVIAARAPQVPGNYRELLHQRLRQAGLALELGDDRVLKEIALFADRCDITEELTRLRHHLVQLGELVRAEGEVGRKAEFILQEIGREIHTVGSKANDLVIAQQVIEFKNELERVREQMANVE
ncbi:MAG: YicC family protein [Opitutae bacterium]|nr:YicC family protein [Opitutae bacterium]